MPKIPGVHISGETIGTVKDSGGIVAPFGYLYCDGSSLSRTTYAKLFAIIGTAFGAADGTHFNLPDLRGVFIRGNDPTGVVDPDFAGRSASKPGGNTAGVGSLQFHQLYSHGHIFTVYVDNATIGALTRGTNGGGGPAGSQGTSNAGGNETRPTNVYFNKIISYI